MNAKARFEATRKAVKRLRDVQLMIMYQCDDWQPEQAHVSHEISDPTARQAAYNVDELEPKLEALRIEEGELLETIGQALMILEAVRSGLGDKYANLLEARYIDCCKWPEIKERYGVKRQNGHYLLDVCFDWIDSVGISRLLNGETEL